MLLELSTDFSSNTNSPNSSYQSSVRRNGGSFVENKGYSIDSSNIKHSDRSSDEDRAPQKRTFSKKLDLLDNFETSFDEENEYVSSTPSQYDETVPDCIKILFEEDYEESQPKQQQTWWKDTFFGETKTSRGVDLANFVSKF